MVIVEGKTIKAVGQDLAVPEGASVIDLGDATLSPGFSETAAVKLLIVASIRASAGLALAGA